VSSDNPGPSPGMLSAAITDLATKVEALEANSGQARGADHLEGRVRAIEAVLTDVRQAVTKLAQNKAREDAHTQMRRPWHMLTAVEAERRWLELRAWVDWFVVRNNIGPKDIPDCWYLHGGLVDELEALRRAWLDTNKPNSKGTDPIWWREALHRARARWSFFNPNGCATSHTETRPRVIDEQREWQNFLAQELADRPADRERRRASGRPASG
jgi:hypothetical protein